MRTKKKKKQDWNEIKNNEEWLKYFRLNFVKNGLRRLSYRWPGRYVALNNGKLDRNEYVCNLCGIVAGKKDIQLDHVVPVIPVQGWDSFDGYVKRLFCPDNMYQVVCRDCHAEKSLAENSLRPKKSRKRIDKSKKEE